MVDSVPVFQCSFVGVCEYFIFAFSSHAYNGYYVAEVETEKAQSPHKPNIR